MQEAAVEGKDVRSEAGVEVAPTIASVIGSASRPAGVPALPSAPEAMPGTAGLWEGIKTVLSSARRGIAAVDERRVAHGDIYRGAFLDRPAVFVWDADEIQKILRNEDRIWSSAMGWDVAMFQGLDKRGGNFGSLLSIDFDDHKKARALVQPAFTMKAVQGYLDTARRELERVIPAWVAAGRVDFKREVRTLLSNIAGQIFTGINDAKEMARIDRALAEFWGGMMALSRTSWLSPTFRRSRRGFETLYTTFLALAPERRKSGGTDLFSHMVQGAAEGTDDDAIVRVFLTIMFGAFDTTSAAVTSMAYLLAKHPTWQQRLRDEATEVGDVREVASLRALKEHEWVWKETMRLMPVSGFVPRRALRDVTIGGHAIAAGTFVMPMQGGIGRHPRWWREPSKFDPERFSPERAEDKQHPALSMAFGSGAHACIGTQLATLEMKLLFHRMLTSCRFTLVKDYEAHHTFTPMGMVSGKVALRLEALPGRN